MVCKSELSQLKRRGIPVEKYESQLENYVTGFPYLKIKDAATPQRGIKVLSEEERIAAVAAADAFEGKCCKFVPASGAASRMFKDLFEGAERLSKGERLEPGSPAQKFVENAKEFPFFDAQHLLRFTLQSNALGYGTQPKGLIEFHKYEDGNRTAFEEHLVEGALYAKDNKGAVNMVVTVSPEHLEGFKSLFKSVRERYEKRFCCKYNIKFTTQSPDTDIIAVDQENRPFLNEKGELLFRPGGHGALLKNLNDINADVIIVKNIDNVTCENHIADTVIWKKVLIGRVIMLRERIASHIKALLPVYRHVVTLTESYKGNLPGSMQLLTEKDQRVISAAKEFLSNEFCIELPERATVEMLLEKLNRPVRLCGMVKNEGEPGGGPYIIAEKDATTSLQILEGAQIDPDNKNAQAALKRTTHFNPVDIVCAVKDYKGKKFDLMMYSDPKTGFISSKSYKGRKLKAQELPGLWNGSMSNWNTQFVEVPITTFNPVKTVLDLLRPMHK